MTKEEILKLRKMGWTFKEIGQKFGVSRQRVQQKLNYQKTILSVEGKTIRVINKAKTN